MTVINVANDGRTPPHIDHRSIEYLPIFKSGIDIYEGSDLLNLSVNIISLLPQT